MPFTITVFGLGFVGLTTALGFADKGNTVYGCDIDKTRTGLLKSGEIPFAEPGLPNALKRNLESNFKVTGEPISAALKSDFIFICVGTPNSNTGKADLSYIKSVLDSIAPVLSDGKFRAVVIKSTVPPSTTSEVIIPYLTSKGLNVGGSFGVANNPEFLREGKCWDDFTNPDRIVCGVCDRRSAEMLGLLYSTFDAPFCEVSLNTGEFIKYLSNTLLATMISYSNEMSLIADAIGGIEVKKAFEVLHMDRRWGGCSMTSYVYPGCGYGGYCLPKDTQALYAKSCEKGFEPELLHNVIITNSNMPRFIEEKIISNAKPSDTIGILGLSFKPESDDVRDSASAKIIALLQKDGFKSIAAYDPVANTLFDRKYEFENIKYCSCADELCKISDILVIATAWSEFRNINKKFPDKIFIDARYYL